MHLVPERKPENVVGGISVLLPGAALEMIAPCIPEACAATEKKP
jgi:hypothetical protein